MKGLTTLANKSNKINQKDRTTWVYVYYSLTEDKVYDKDGEGRYLVCYLINPNTPAEIQEAVEDWKKS